MHYNNNVVVDSTTANFKFTPLKRPAMLKWTAI